MRGKTVDMDMLRKRNELTPAVGNARVNARGDELGAGGKIIRKKEEIIQQYYNQVPDSSGRAKKPTDTVKESSIIQEELTSEEKSMVEDLDEENSILDNWVEDDEGNFVKKKR
jgi:hypothetical protein